MRRWLIVMICGMTLGCCGTGYALPSEQALAAALQQKRYPEVIEGLQAYLAAGYANAQMHHQLSEAYYHTGQKGKALAHTLKGLRLSPHHRALNDNLSWLRAMQEEELQPPPVFFLQQWWESISGLMPVNAWAILGLVWLWLGAALVGAHRWVKPAYQGKKWLKPTGYGLLIAASLPFGWAATRSSMMQRTNQAVVVAPKTPVRVAPATESEAELEVSEGVELKVIDQAKGWYKVSLANGSQGWIAAPALEVI